jgi:hypothetical protein
VPLTTADVEAPVEAPQRPNGRASWGMAGKSSRKQGEIRGNPIEMEVLI